MACPPFPAMLLTFSPPLTTPALTSPYHPSVPVWAVGYLHAPWKDMACPPFPTMLSIVQSISLAIGRRHKVAVHCHAGLGRTGLVIACYLVAANSLSAADAVAVVRAMRPGSLQTRKQEVYVAEFQAFVRGDVASGSQEQAPLLAGQYSPESAVRRAKERSVGDVEEHSGIRLRNRFISAPQLRQKLADIRFLRLEAISSALIGGRSQLAGAWATIAVISGCSSVKATATAKPSAAAKPTAATKPSATVKATATATKPSSSSRPFMSWKLSCLSGPLAGGRGGGGGGGGRGGKGGGGGQGGVEEVTLLLFGAAFDVYCKQEMGTVVAVLGAEASPPKGVSQGTYRGGQQRGATEGACQVGRSGGGDCVIVWGDVFPANFDPIRPPIPYAIQSHPPSHHIRHPILSGLPSHPISHALLSEPLQSTATGTLQQRITRTLAEYCDQHSAAAYQKMKPTHLELDTISPHPSHSTPSDPTPSTVGTLAETLAEYCDRHIAAAYQKMKPTRLELDGGNLSTAFLYRNNVRRSRQVLLGNGTCGSGSSRRRGARPVAALDQDALRCILREKDNLTSRPVSQGKRFLAAASGDEEQAPYVPPLKRAKGVENGTVRGETLGCGSGVTVSKATGSGVSGKGGLLPRGSVRGGVKEGVDVQDGVIRSEVGGGVVEDGGNVHGGARGGKVVGRGLVTQGNQGKSPNWMLREQRFQPTEKMVELDVDDNDDEDNDMGAASEVSALHIFRTDAS
ncbi:unnamed protein product [Closterium sp. Naga37s-1]|nr:unnamed protein product [Closterium sp. Naga37s-1]